MAAMTRKRALQIAILLFVSMLLLGAGDDNQRFDRLGHRMMCVCSCNQVLLECNHVGCAYSDRMRNELKVSLTRGDSDDLTLQGFVQKYGPVVLAAPTAAGFNRVAWIMPFFVLTLGTLAVVVVIKAWNRRLAPAPTSSSSPAEKADMESYRRRAREETEV